MADSEREEPYSRAMVVMAHADDMEWTCAATLSKFCAEGWEVVLVLCTDGSKGSDDLEMTSERLAEIRAEEQEESARVLGLKDVVFLGYPDSYLEPTLQLRKDIAREIRRHRPDIVITEPPTRDIDSRYYGSHPTTWLPERPRWPRSSPRLATGLPSPSCWRRDWNLTRCARSG